MDAWCASTCCRCPAGGGLHGYYLVADCLAMGLPRFSAQPACGAAGDKLQPLHHECTCILPKETMAMKKKGKNGCSESLVRVPETSTRHGGCVRASRESSSSKTPWQAALGRDAPPAPVDRNENPRLSGGQGRECATNDA